MEVHDEKSFFINIYKNNYNENIFFANINNLFHPATIEECFDKNISGPTPKIKDKNGNWNLRGHPKRVIDIQKNELKLFAKLLDSSDKWKEARLPLLYATELIPILEVLANQDQPLESLKDSLYQTVMFDETNAQNKGIIKKSVHIPNSLLDTIYSGPNIGLSNPLFKASRKIHKFNSDYDNIDLLEIPENFRPRVVFSPACDNQTYLSFVPSMKYGKKYNSEYRIFMRRRFSNSNERSLFPAVAPKDVGHIQGIFGIYPQQHLTVISALLSSIVHDFLIRITGKSDIRWNIFKHLPFLTNKRFYKLLSLRALLLNCLTIDYADLWRDEYKNDFQNDSFSKLDPRLPKSHFQKLKNEWSWHTPLRSDYARRQALVEIDVLSAISLGLSLEHLKTIYRFQFEVFRSYENNTYYDAHGRIVFTNNMSLKNVGFSSKEFDEIKDKKTGVFKRTIIDNTLSDTPVERTIEYFAPFDKCNRDLDYEIAWDYFSKLKL
jgi:hypothetical protein